MFAAGARALSCPAGNLKERLPAHYPIRGNRKQEIRHKFAAYHIQYNIYSNSTSACNKPVEKDLSLEEIQRQAFEKSALLCLGHRNQAFEASPVSDTYMSQECGKLRHGGSQRCKKPSNRNAGRQSVQSTCTRSAIFERREKSFRTTLDNIRSGLRCCHNFLLRGS